MDSSTLNYTTSVLNSGKHLDYFSAKPNMFSENDFMTFVIENLHHVFSKGNIKGDVLIDFSFGFLVYHLYSASDYFKDITVLKVNDGSITEMENWLSARPGAFDSSPAAKLLSQIEGKGDQFKDKDKKVRSTVRRVVKVDPEKESLMNPMVSQPADAVISVELLDVLSHDKDKYMRYLKKMEWVLKDEGRLIIIGNSEATYMKAGENKFNVLNYDEDFLKKALVDEGFKIDYIKVKKKDVMSDLTDSKALMFIVAQKKN
ncbi:indolethylamine N-methyltransferase-like [Phyllobates terribilis]|uniref:indolethylamine N-methyltransferase-like n=1 Tax=Phyllobates terribilis TaxID=111132 RepID=UPI003CCAE779